VKAMVSPDTTPVRDVGAKTFALASPTTTLCWTAETAEARIEAEAANVVKKRMVIFLKKKGGQRS